MFRQLQPRGFFQAPACPVADHGVADLLRNGEAEAYQRVAVAARADEEDETGGGGAQDAVRREEIRAAVELADLYAC